ncbi:CHAT domain-containing protein [Novosphingobium profundi]|uniref:CHAT domain-containing tetratricopeptide repeat protein n=1 Tax=Novosphingobium profundi TaxID=1774954 RepID=UPI001BD99871|nr:CHAT domain-containing protein [Novosphingobium profundi]MBT0667745.1 CHAT domain-containing protein [Novosphingobium profundi]
MSARSLAPYVAGRMGNGAKSLLVWVLTCAALAGAPARAQCGPALAEPEAASPLERSFAQALSQDKYRDAAGQAQRWRELMAQAADGQAVAPFWRVRGQTRLAWELEYSDQAEAALGEGRKALDMIGAAGLTGSALEGEAHVVMATILADRRELAPAQEAATRALAVAQASVGARSALASLAHNALGTVAYARGQYVEAERQYAQAVELAVACQPAQDPAIVNQLASHAGTLFMIGEVEAALQEAQRAANWASAHVSEDSPVQTLALGNLGALLLTTGRFAEAERALRRVVDLEATYQPQSWYYRAVSLSNYAGVLRRLGRIEEAEALWLAAAGFHRKASIGRDPSSASFPLRNAADAALERGDLRLALARREEAVRLLDKVAPAEDPERARAHLERASARLLLGQARAARREADPAIAILRRGYEETSLRRMPAEIDYARILAETGQLEAAYALASEVAQRLEVRLLDAATSRGDLVRYGSAFAASFSTATELALRTGRDEQAFHYLQLANMSDIVVVTNEVAARAAAADPQTAASIRDFQDRVRRRQALERESSFALAAGDGARAAQLAAQIAQNDADIAALGSQLDRIAPRLRALGRPVPVTLADYRARLGEDEALVAPLLLDERVITLVVTREGLTWGQSPVPRARMRGWLVSLRASLDPNSVRAIVGKPPAFAYDAARALYSALFPVPVAKAIVGKANLIYFATGHLAGLPIALLPTSARGLSGTNIDPARIDPAGVDWLVRAHSVRIAPSLVPPAPSRARSGQAMRFLGVGAPRVGPRDGDPAQGHPDLSDLPALPGARRELTALAEVFGASRSTLLLGAQANARALATLPLTDYAIVTFATHGLGVGERVGLDEPALVLSPETGDDGLLTASRIMQLHLDADWVILSACDTAGGAGVGAPLLSGLASAFLHAGARALLVSHWPVRDDVAARLVTESVRLQAEGMDAAQALQRAQLELIDAHPLPGSAEPGNWAAMVLVEG